MVSLDNSKPRYYFKTSGSGPDGIRTHDLCGKFFLTQCECVIQTKLDDRSNHFTMLGVFLSLDFHNDGLSYQKQIKFEITKC